MELLQQGGVASSTQLGHFARALTFQGLRAKRFLTHAKEAISRECRISSISASGQRPICAACGASGTLTNSSRWLSLPCPSSGHGFESLPVLSSLERQQSEVEETLRLIARIRMIGASLTQCSVGTVAQLASKKLRNLCLGESPSVGFPTFGIPALGISHFGIPTVGIPAFRMPTFGIFSRIQAPLNQTPLRPPTKKIHPKEEVLSRMSLRTCGQKPRSGPPNPGKTCILERTSHADIHEKTSV